jgi:hypothetical protein
MPFQVSPGVNVSEIDLTTTVPAVATTTGAIAAGFQWGPVEDPVLVSSQTELIDRFSKPSNNYFEGFFTASNFLSYGNALYVTRGVSNAAYNAITNDYGDNTTQIKNADAYDVAATGAASNTEFIAKYPGALGNSLKISVCSSSNQYSKNITLSTLNTQASITANSITANISNGANTLVVTVVTSATLGFEQANAGIEDIRSDLQVGEFIKIGNSSIGTQYLQIKSVGSASITSNATNDIATANIEFESKNTLGADSNQSNIERFWEYYNVVSGAPSRSQFFAERNANTSLNDSLHIVVEDEDGTITGVAGQVLEVFENLSRTTDAKTDVGNDNYYKTVLRDRSNWVYYGQESSALSGKSTTAAATDSNVTVENAENFSFVAGSDGAAESSSDILGGIQLALDKYKNKEEIDISIMMTGKTMGGTNGTQVANYIIDNITSVRKDCVACVSPEYADVVSTATIDRTQNIVDFRNSLTSSSYAILDSGYKYQYDKFSDVYRWVPLNGDIGGTIARTDLDRDFFFSPAGLQRGSIKNVIKLAWNPDKADRDLLYQNDINPVVTFPGSGVILFGDKTLLGRPSAFDRINVRRLFITLEKAIERAAQSLLFEFNDEFTRAQFKNLVEPFLRDIQGRRGIYDFKVVCDETNNTGSVIDRNEFVGDIFIKPARSINFIQLNFVAVRTGVEFSEVVGSV